MEMLVAYDVDTTTPAGQRRLRRVAHVCEAYGQRVQKSVFECVLNGAELQRLLAHLSTEIDHSQDSLRIYHLQEPRANHLHLLGKQPPHDVREPLVL